MKVKHQFIDDSINVWVEPRKVKRQFWFGEKTRHFVCTDYMTWGPYPSEEVAWSAAYGLIRFLRRGS